MAHVQRSRRDDVRDPELLADHFYIREGRLWRDINRFGHLTPHRQGVPLRSKNGELFNWLRFMNVKLRADHVAIAVEEGAWPDDVVHEDGNTLNDHLGNLTPVFDMKLPKGVVRSGAGYAARTWTDGTNVYHGTFPSIYEAMRAREDYARRQAEDDKAIRERKASQKHLYFNDDPI